MKKFKDYVTKFDYGNKDVSGDNALTNSWLSSSLKISPEEQVAFLDRMSNRKLSISKKAYNMTKEIIYIQELSNGWKLYGKTGNGRRLDQNRIKTELQQGWFVGWIEKNGRVITFADHVVDDKKENSFASFRARGDAFIRLFHIIDELEK